MKAVENYAESERPLDVVHEIQAERGPDDDSVRELLAEAQVRATLALAGATALQSYARVGDSDGELADWEHAAGGDAE